MHSNAKEKGNRRPKSHARKDPNKAARLIRMIRTLYARGMTRAEMAHEFQIARRHTYDYLRDIEKLGYIFSEDDNDGERVWRIEGGFLGIKPEPATVPELMALYLAKCSMAHLHGTPFMVDLERLVRKIEAGLPAKTANKIERLVEVFLPSQRPIRSYEKHSQTLCEIQKALLYQRPIRIRYRSLGHETAVVHKVEPYVLQSFEYGLYLLGYSSRAKDFRRFAVERMEEASVDMTIPPFALRPEHEQHTKSQRAFGLTEGPLMDVSVRFDRAVADYFKERKWHPTQKVRTLKSGDVVVALQAGGIDEIVAWVLGWGAYARVIGPQQLLERVRDELAQAHQRYVT